MIKNILWDVNDTLFDTHPAVTYAFSKALNEIGQSVAMNVIDDLVRRSVDEAVMFFSQRYKLEPDRLRARFREAYRAVSLANQPPFPGVHEVCEFIHRNGGLNIAITHRNLDSVCQFLDVHDMSALIDDIISAGQGYPDKPDPAMVFAALKKHSLNPTETLLIGNSERDILAGRKAGVHTCLFGLEETSVLPDLHVKSYEQLLDLLAKA